MNAPFKNLQDFHNKVFKLCQYNVTQYETQLKLARFHIEPNNLLGSISEHNPKYHLFFTLHHHQKIVRFVHNVYLALQAYTQACKHH